MNWDAVIAGATWGAIIATWVVHWRHRRYIRITAYYQGRVDEATAITQAHDPYGYMLTTRNQIKDYLGDKEAAHFVNERIEFPDEEGEL